MRRGRPWVGVLVPGVRLRPEELVAVQACMAREGCGRAEAIRRLVRRGAGLATEPDPAPDPAPVPGLGRSSAGAR